jgi:histidyl-tRNA synthetase
MPVKTQPARGMRDFLPADVRRREYVIGVIRDVYERYGFEPLETPAVENIETLTGKYGEEGNQLIFKILKRGEHEKTGEADLALRYDLTVPLARVVAEYGDKLPKFFKRYQIQPVWRADRPARGRFREFYQCDVDAIGSRSMIVEAEICAAAGDALSNLGFANYTIRLNHRQVLTGVLDRAGIPTDKHSNTLTALDKLDKISKTAVMDELIDREIPFGPSMKLLDFFDGIASLNKPAELVAGEGLDSQREAFNGTVLGRLVEFVGDHKQGSRGVDELRQILQFARASGIGSRIKIDPSLARGLSYYTGAIMEINVPYLTGSLGGGGRYDNLVGMFSKQSIPACGFSLGLERIIVVMTESEMFPPELVETNADVLVTIWDEESAADALALARELRAAGVRVDVYPGAEKIGKQLKYASSIGVPFVVVAGTDERARGEVALKDMRTGKQRNIKVEAVGMEINQAIKGRLSYINPVARLYEINNLALINQERGNITEARRLLSQSLEISRELGDQYSAAFNLYYLGDLAQRQGELSEALRFYSESLVVARQLGINNQVVSSLQELARISEEQDDNEKAAQLLQEAFKIYDELKAHHNELVSKESP